MRNINTTGQEIDLPEITVTLRNHPKIAAIISNIERTQKNELRRIEESK